MKTIKDEPRTLADKLARCLLSYRITPHTVTGCIPAELLIGCRIRTRLAICIQICWLECRRKLSSETIPHVVTFYLVTHSWLEIIGIVSDRGSKESSKIAWGLLRFELQWISCNRQLVQRSQIPNLWLRFLVMMLIQKQCLRFNPSNRRWNHQTCKQIPPSPRGSQNLVPVFALEEPDLYVVPLSQIPKVSRTEEPTKFQSVIQPEFVIVN